MYASATLSGDVVKFITALDIEHTMREIIRSINSTLSKTKLLSSVGLAIPSKLGCV
jgi:hypothetical protein